MRGLWCSGHQDLTRFPIDLCHHRLLYKQADVQAEGGDEPDVEKHNDRQVPAPSCPFVVNILRNL